MDKKRNKLTKTKDKSNEDTRSATQAPSTSKTNVSLIDDEFYANLNDRERFLNVTSLPVSKRGIYNSGATSLPIDLNEILQTESFYHHSEDNEVDRPTETGFEITIPNHEKMGGFRKEEFLGPPGEQSRNIIGQETSQRTQSSRRIAVEAAPRERKRWVRPPLVGQSTNDSSAVSQNNSTATASRADDLNLPQTSNTTENIDSFTTLDPFKAKKFSNTTDIQSSSSYFNAAVLGLRNDVDSGALAKPPNSYNAAPDSQNQGQDTTTSEMDVTGASGCGRAPSPASVSSVTSSRRLEWDSGADVGYQAYRQEDGENTRKKDLSTLERMALARGPAPLRVEPEGIDGSAQRTSALAPNNASYMLRTPVAVSTPIERDFNIAVTSNSGTDSESDIMPIVRSHKERLFFFPGSEKNDGVALFSKDVKRSQTPEAEASSDVLSRKISSSLTDLSDCGTCEEKNKNSNSLPRSQSHLNLLLEPNHKQKISAVSTSSCPLPLRSQHKKNNGRSASSSSIATVVPKYESPRMSDKRTQTSLCNMLDRNSIGVQVCDADGALKLEESDDAAVITEHDLGSEESDSDIINNTENDIDTRRQMLVLKGTYSKKTNSKSTCMPEGSTVNVNKKKNSSKQRHTSNTSEANACSVQNKSDADSNKLDHTKTQNEKFISTVDSRASSAGSWILGSLNGNLRRDSSGVVGSANSFEYLPGDIYENNQPTTSEDKNFQKSQGTEDSSSQSDLLCESDLKSLMFPNDTELGSLKKDLQKGIVLLKELLNSKCYSSSAKKKLVRLLVNRIVETDYADDSASVQKVCERSASSSSATEECTGHSDTYTNSRVETTTLTTSSSVNTMSSGKGSWRDFATQSERDYERSKHNSSSQGYKSVLLKVCETERENQLSWISTEINHLNNLKHKDQDRRGNERPKRSPRKDQRHFRSLTNMNSRSVSSSIQNDHKKIGKHRALAEGIKYPASLRPSDLEIQELLVLSQNDVCVKKKDVSSQIPSTSDSDARVSKHIPTPVSPVMSTFSTLELTADTQSDVTTTGRINVYPQTVKKANAERNISLRKSSRSEMKNKDALCCCECKKLVNEVKTGEIMIGSKTGDVETGDKIRRNSRATDTSTASSSGTIKSADKGHVKGLLKPNTDPTLTHTQRSVLERLINMSDGKCPCCGCLEGETSSQLGSGDWKCPRCADKTIRKCYVCGFNVVEHDASPKVDVTQKCKNCLKRKNSKCLRCGKVQQVDGENEAERQDVIASSHTRVDKSSVGYVLTLESATLSDSSVSTLLKEPLQELKMKVPVRKTYSSISSNEKVQEKSKKSSSSKSSRKENKKPEKSTKQKSRNHIQARGYTLQNAEHRRQCLDEIAYLRELRQNSKQKILAIASHPNIEAETNADKILPLPLAVKRIFSQRTMRAQTERKYHNLPEVLSKKAERKRKEDYRTNRLMAEIFAKKLQKKVLKGEVNLSNSRSVISIN
ncbi:hypothetical protein C0J52_18056 [Blattella germanica]|nr:hypothetical protein C0J52_18056 [Blattella germanica]